jgi:signal transduction histidine kinase
MPIKGTGLSLSIVQHISALHQGEIFCDKASLGGLKIQISFPTFIRLTG